MKTLGIHSAGPGCSVALLEGDRLISVRHTDAARGQAELLMPMVLEVLREAGVGLKLVDRFGVTVGPGSFTGLRIGLAAVRGMMMATGRPGVGVTSFEAAAHGVSADEIDGRLLLIAVESKRAELFVQAFDTSWNPIAEPEALLPEHVAERYSGREVTIAGDGAVRLKPVLPGGRFCEAAPPEAVAVARLAASRDPSGPPPRPVYLRAPDVTLPGRPR